MIAYLSRRYRISASHRLDLPSLSREENEAIYGKCNNPYGHGHNYTIEVTVGGQVDARTGMVCDLAALDACVKREVIERFDHSNLNLSDSFLGAVPTTENLCRVVYRLIAEHFRGATLERVRVEETSNNFFEYSERKKHGQLNGR